MFLFEVTECFVMYGLFDIFMTKTCTRQKKIIVIYPYFSDIASGYVEK